MDSLTINEFSIHEKLDNVFKEISHSNREIMPGISWGSYSQLFTPAYWKVQYHLHHVDDDFTINYKLGKNILEEIVACLLGGFGIKAEIGLAAFGRLKNRGYIVEGVDYISISNSLKEPFKIYNKYIHYRFSNQKAKYINKFLNRKDLQKIPLNNDLIFRNWLLTVSGIGPKTASWITRNYFDSENVAIIDIHIYRAGMIAGIFSNRLKIQKDYFKLEKIFLQFCRALNVQPSKMDALMWIQMKESNRTAIKLC